MTLTIINNYLVNTCREMGLAMMKTSYSSIFNEGLDFSCVVFDRDAQMVSYAEFCPAQIGAILYTMQWTIAEVGLENFAPGDVVMHNDPYRGGCHLPEHTVIKPVYHRGELYGFVGNIAHLTEIGGKAVGGFAADAREIYQEGLRLPPVKIMRGGEYVDDIWKIILTNHRTPRTSWGDFHAMIGSLTVAERRLHQLLDRYGFDAVLDAGRELMDYAERRMRAEIAEIPDGEYAFEDWIENDGVVADRRYRIHCTAVVRGERIIFDYNGSSPQAQGPCNCTYGVTASATYNAMLNLTDRTIPRNSGCYRPIELIVPPGTVVNVEHPGPSVAATPRSTSASSTSCSAACLRRCPSAWRPPPAPAPATSCSAAPTRAPASSTPTTTSKAAAGAARRPATATTASARSTATAATRRSRCSRPATRGSPTATAWRTAREATDAAAAAPAAAA